MFTNSHTDSHEQKQLKVRLQQMRAIDKFWKRGEQIQVIIDKTELRKLEGRTSQKESAGSVSFALEPQTGKGKRHLEFQKFGVWS